MRHTTPAERGKDLAVGVRFDQVVHFPRIGLQVEQLGIVTVDIDVFVLALPYHKAGRKYTFAVHFREYVPLTSHIALDQRHQASPITGQPLRRVHAGHVQAGRQEIDQRNGLSDFRDRMERVGAFSETVRLVAADAARAADAIRAFPPGPWRERMAEFARGIAKRER